MTIKKIFFSVLADIDKFYGMLNELNDDITQIRELFVAGNEDNLFYQNNCKNNQSVINLQMNELSAGDDYYGDNEELINVQNIRFVPISTGREYYSRFKPNVNVNHTVASPHHTVSFMFVSLFYSMF